jgi:hypothetical protein
LVVRTTLKNWGAPWLVREILAARDQRLGRGREVEAVEGLRAASVEVPPLVQRPPAIPWDEFIAGHRAGLIEWNRARLGPKPGQRLSLVSVRCTRPLYRNKRTTRAMLMRYETSAQLRAGLIQFLIDNGTP